MAITREQLQNKVDEIIFNYGKEFNNLFNQYTTLKADENYSLKYKEKKKDEILQEVYCKRDSAYEKALALIEKERAKLEEEKNSYSKLSLEERKVKALEKNNLIQITMLKVKGAPINQLRDIMYSDNFDEDIREIILSELNRRVLEKKELTDEEKVLSRELRMTKDVFSPIEYNIRSKMLNADSITISYGNVRSITKCFDIQDSQHYFTNVEKEEVNHYFN